MTADSPLFAITRRVRPEWIDYNGHMAVAYYAQVFDECAEAFYESLGLGRSSAETGGGSLFSLEHHNCFLKELGADTPLEISLQLLDWDIKRLHYFMRLRARDTAVLAATSEQLAIHVDMGTRSSTPLPDEARMRLAEMWAAHRTYATPREAGHVIRIRRKQEIAP